MWDEPREKEGDRKATGSWSTMEVYYPPSLFRLPLETKHVIRK